MKQGRQLDFSGQNIFVGMDVHKNSWKVCIRNEETRCIASPAKLAEMQSGRRKMLRLYGYKIQYKYQHKPNTSTPVSCLI